MNANFKIPVYRDSEEALTEKAMVSLIKKSNQLFNFSSKGFRHFGPTRNVREPQILDQKFKPLESNSSINNVDIQNANIEAWIELIINLTSQQRVNLERYAMDGLHEVTLATGYRTDANGMPFSIDLLIQLLDKMPISFNDGKPELPTLIVNPETGSKIVNKLNEIIEKDKNQMNRWEIFIKRKEREYYAQKRTRRLS